MSLTKQQIESEGWIPRDEFNNFWTKDDEGHTARDWDKEGGNEWRLCDGGKIEAEKYN